MKKTILICFFSLILSLLTTPLYAQHKTWKDPSFNFLGVKKVLVLPPTTAPYIKREIVPEKSMEFICKFLEKSKIDYLTLDDIYPPMLKHTKEDLLKGLPLEGNVSEVLPETKQFADIILALHVSNCGYSYQLIEAHDESYETYEDVYVKGDVNATVSIPVTKQIHVPSSRVEYSNASCTISLYEIDKGNRVWTFEATKVRRNVTFSRISDLGMLKILVRAGVKKLPISHS